jgi:predicted nucleic acid-binding protein
MRAYLDSSVLLRKLLDQPNQLLEWPKLRFAVTSQLAEVECLRTLDRLGLRGLLEHDEVTERRKLVYQLLDALTVVPVEIDIIRAASRPFGAPLGTLDALHLATALEWSSADGRPLVFATHDQELAAAAGANGFTTIGTVS